MKLEIIKCLAGIFVFGVRYTFCAASYKLRNDGVELKYTNSSIVKDVAFNVNFNTNDKFTISVGYTVLQGLADDILVELKVYSLKKESDWKLYFKWEYNLCQLWKNLVNEESIAKYGNVTGCGLQKDTRYFIQDYSPNPDSYPPLIPFNIFKVDIVLWKDQSNIVIVRWYMTVKPPTENFE